MGWVALTPFSPRACYGGVAEVSVYVRVEARGGGVGAALLGAVVESAERGGIWTLQAGIFPENVRRRAPVAITAALRSAHGFDRSRH